MACELSGACACSIHRSEFGLLSELGSQNCLYCSSPLERCCQFSALNSGCRGSTALVITGADSETSGLSACQLESPEI
eukprot:7601565-Pyramimonas_sp.AAC.1